MSEGTIAGTDSTLSASEQEVLGAVGDRVLWLATSIVHHANKIRETRSGVKVGGHRDDRRRW